MAGPYKIPLSYQRTADPANQTASAGNGPLPRPKFAKELEQEQSEAPQSQGHAYPTVDWKAVRAGLKEGKEKFVHEAIYPKNSILTPYVEHVRKVCEGVDGYIIGSVLPVVAAALGRRVWFPWDNGPLYTNLFTILVGKPGDRKTSATKSAAKLATILLAPNAFLPTNVSAEALFDEYYELAGGRPDKFWVCHDAHVVLENWKKSSHGERVSAMFLLLFDCMELTESFLRNRKKDEKAKRIVEETSTSILFGATFRDAAFEGTQIKAGMARRFLYYAGAGHGRTLVLPEQIVFGKTADLFKPLLAFCGAMKLSDEAYKRWTDYQYENRRQMDELGINQEDLCARLNTSPTWVLKIAMIFEACVAVSDDETEWYEISDDSLCLAIKHVEQNLRSAEYVNRMIEQKAMTDEAEIILAVIREEFRPEADGTRFVSRSQLTRRFCAHGRGRTLTVDDLYLKIIPALEKIGMAKLVVEKGNLKIYAFAPEEQVSI